MARHRGVRNLNIDEAREEFDEYGRSVDDQEMCVSPNTQRFMYIREESTSRLSDFLEHSRDGIAEEDEEFQYCEEDDIGFFPQDQCVQNGSTVVPDSSSPSSANNGSLFRIGDIPLLKAQVSEPKKKKGPSPQPTPPRSRTPEDGLNGNFRNLSVQRQTKEKDRSASPRNRRQASSLSPPPAGGISAQLGSVSAKPRLKERPKGGKELLNLVVVGHVDAGKSTLMGNVNQRLMHKYKQESQKLGKASFAYAWVLDETSEERERGVTMDIAQTRFETDHKQVILLDAPGHKDFIPNMITGAAQADVAILVVNATRGEFETGFDQGGQTREHAMLIRSLGVSQLLVVVNKLDTVGWSQERYAEIQEKLSQFLRKQAGFPDATFLPACGVSGENLITPPPPGHPLAQWYDGPTLLQAIDNFKDPGRTVDKPLRFCISDVFKQIGSGGFTLAGKVETGSVETGDRVIIMPNNDQAQVKSIQTDEALENAAAFAGDQCLLSIVGTIDINNVNKGHVLCHPESAITPVTRFEARIVVFNIAIPITKGFPASIHYQSTTEPAVIAKLVSQISKSSGQITRKNPRCLVKNSSGLVELKVERAICLEVYENFKELGRFTLRANGQTIAAGVVTKLL